MARPRDALCVSGLVGHRDAATATACASCAQVILATNIAETSITISGVRYVVDTGFVKARNYR